MSRSEDNQKWVSEKGETLALAEPNLAHPKAATRASLPKVIEPSVHNAAGTHNQSPVFCPAHIKKVDDKRRFLVLRLLEQSYCAKESIFSKCLAKTSQSCITNNEADELMLVAKNLSMSDNVIADELDDNDGLEGDGWILLGTPVETHSLVGQYDIVGVGKWHAS